MLLLVGCSSAEELDGQGSDTVSQTTDTEAQTESPEDLSIPKKYQLIYNSDTTHIEQNDSPYHEGDKNTTLTKSMVKASVEEAIDAGADCFALSPGQCWVPWWPSEYIDEHIDWYKNEFGGSNFSNPFWNYIHIRGNDLIQDMIDVCRDNDTGFFISFRLNDAHHVTGNRTPESSDVAFDTEIAVSHPEYRIGYVPSWGREEVVLDFQHEEVVQNRLELIGELIENYEIDGFELDFTRRYVLFNVDTTTEEQRLEIMLSFIGEVRDMLNAATEKDGRYRHLSVRIPIWDEYYDELGIDLEEYEKAGVTVFNFTGSYFTVQEFDLTVLTSRIKNEDTLVYCELHFITAVDYDDGGKRIHKRATVEQLCTTAAIAYEQGADGISLFNFQYYRGDRVSEEDKPYTEPPWEVIELLKDREALLGVAQHYFLGKTWRDSFYSGWSLPKTLTKNADSSFEMYCVSPADGWSGEGVLTLQSLDEFGSRSITVKLNGITLTETPWAGKPYDNKYTQMIGTAANYKSYTVPLSALNEGINTVTVTLTSGSNISLCFIELSVGV